MTNLDGKKKEFEFHKTDPKEGNENIIVVIYRFLYGSFQKNGIKFVVKTLFHSVKVKILSSNEHYSKTKAYTIENCLCFCESLKFGGNNILNDYRLL